MWHNIVRWLGHWNEWRRIKTQRWFLPQRVDEGKIKIGPSFAISLENAWTFISISVHSLRKKVKVEFLFYAIQLYRSCTSNSHIVLVKVNASRRWRTHFVGDSQDSCKIMKKNHTNGFSIVTKLISDIDLLVGLACLSICMPFIYNW